MLPTCYWVAKKKHKNPSFIWNVPFIVRDLGVSISSNRFFVISFSPINSSALTKSTAELNDLFPTPIKKKKIFTRGTVLKKFNGKLLYDVITDYW